METQDTGTLAAALLQLKEQEDEARQARIMMEERLIAALDFKKPEGSQTYEAGRFKVTLRRPISRSVDGEAWEGIRESLVGADAEAAAKLMRIKYELNTAEARALEDALPSLWRKVALCITSKPGKVSVEVKDGGA